MAQLNLDLVRDGVAYADQWLAYQQERREIPGITVAVRCDDALVLSRGYGYADLDHQIPMTPAHIFRIASHSKTFTATAILQLRERGALRLDDRLADHLPWLRRGDYLERPTIRQALTHTTGLVRDGHDAGYWQLDGPFPDAGELRRLVEDDAVILAGDEAFKYSNIGYGLLGAVVEAASGQPYHAYVRRNIVDRLGLADTGPETSEGAGARLATGYTAPRFGMPRRPIPDVPTGALAAATGFYSTAEDVARYAAAHFLGDETLLSDPAKREMQQPYWQVACTDGHYGLGFAVYNVGDRRLVGHGGAFPGHATRTLFDPVDRLAVVVMTNEIGGPAEVLAQGIVRIIDVALRQPPAQEAFRAARGRYTGRFANIWGVTDVAAFGTNLFALNPDGDDPTKAPASLAVVDDETLRITAASGYAAPGEPIRYFRDATGQVKRIVAGGMPSYPVADFLARPIGG